MIYDDMPRWWAFLARIREGNEETEGKYSKTAQNGAQRGREGNGAGEAGLTNGQGREGKLHE